MKHPPLFKRIELQDAKKIGTIQNEFEAFWKKLTPMVDKNPEKTMAMRKLQEACMWLCRSESMNQFQPSEDDKNDKPWFSTPKGENAAQQADLNPNEEKKPSVNVVYKKTLKKNPE